MGLLTLLRKLKRSDNEARAAFDAVMAEAGMVA